MWPRLLKWSTWKVRGNSAAEASLLVAVAALIVPLVLFVGASWITYCDTLQQAEERIERTPDPIYADVQTTLETEYLVAANVEQLVSDFECIPQGIVPPCLPGRQRTLA